MTDNRESVDRDSDVLLTVVDVSAIVRAPVATLRYWRHLSTGPKSFRLGRGVRYWRSDVMAWLKEKSDGNDHHVA